MKLIAVVAVVVFLIVSGYRIAANRLKTDLALNSKVAAIANGMVEARTAAIDKFNGLIKDAKSSFKKLPLKNTGQDNLPVEAVVLHLKHGGVISGHLLAKSGNSYTVDWKGEKFVIDAGKVSRVEYKTQRDIEWPYKNDVVALKSNGIVLDGRIVDVDNDTVTMSFPEGGGAMEMGTRLSEIDRLLFAPVCNRESQEIDRRLKKLFPKMKVYKEGNVTIITDSYDTWVKAYKKAVNQKYGEIYLKFFKLFDGRRPMRQNFVVVFDNWEDYLKNMFADMGFVSAGIVGYFSPTDKVLYLYNAWGQNIEKFYYDWVTLVSGAYDKASDRIRSRYKDTSVDIMVEGLSKDLQDKYWDWYTIHKDIATDQTMAVLRHELTHEILHNWRLQSIIISKANVDKDKMARKKKEILDAIEGEDREKLEKLFVELMKLRKTEYEGLMLDAANSWLAEGMATYCETEPIGSINEERLFNFQESERKNTVNPIEFLTNFKVGSFAGLCGEATLDAYGESWALTAFLMARYPNQFIEFQIRMADKKDDSNNSKEELQLLLDCLKKDLPALEKEFRDYTGTYDKTEDPDIKLFMRYQKVKDAFYEVWKTHGG